MSRSDASARRSGDPRKRAAQAEAPTPTGIPRQLAVAIVAILALAVLALVLLWPEDEEPESAGREHAVVACDLTVKADEAAEGNSRARYAASVLLLDQAIISSARAAGNDVAFADLDEAVQAVHTAGHQGDPEAWEDALATALAACGDTID